MDQLPSQLVSPVSSRAQGVAYTSPEGVQSKGCTSLPPAQFIMLFHITNLDFLRSPASSRVDACGSKTAPKGRLGAIIGIRQAVCVANERNLKVKVCFVKVH